MVKLHWPRRSTFLGPSREYVGPGTFDVPDSEEEAFRDRGWEDPPDDGDSAAESGGSDGEGAPAGDDNGTITDLMNADLSEYTVGEIREAVMRVELTTDEKADLMERERDGKNRTTALKAIED